MVSVVSDAFVSTGCPRALQPLAEVLRGLVGHAFEDDDDLRMFVRGLGRRVSDAADAASVLATVMHNRDMVGGTLSIIRSVGSGHDYARLRYVRVRGTIAVGGGGSKVSTCNDENLRLS